MSHGSLAKLIDGVTAKEPDLPVMDTTTMSYMTTTVEDSVQELWAFGAHEIISIAIVGVSVIVALIIAAIYYSYKFCRCCHKCRKSEEVSTAKEADPNAIEGIFVTRADWDKPKPELRPVQSTTSIKSFL